MAKSFNAQMSDRFRKITADYNTINVYIHETGMLILNHAKEHGDCSTAQGLINAMPQSARKLALVSWFHKYSPIVVKDSDKWLAKMHKPDSNLYVPFAIEEAQANPWYTLADKMGAEKAPATIADMVKWLESQANAWEKKADDGKVSDEEILTARALAASLRSIKIKHIPVAANSDTFKGNIVPETQEPQAVTLLEKVA